MPNEPQPAEPVHAHPHLARALGPWTAAAIVVGTVIGSGVFKKPAAVALDAPQFGVAISTWILLGVLVTLGALALAECAVVFPRTGGGYVFLREAYGRAFGFMWGWIDFTVIRTGSIAALAVIFAESLNDMLRQLGDGSDVLSFWQQHAIAQGAMFILGLVNARGIRWGAGVQFLFTSIKVGGIVALALLPFGLIRLIEGAPQPSAANLEPLWPDALHPFDLAKYGAALIAVQWAYHGWQNLAPMAGEVSNPRRNFPLALLAGVAVIAMLYIGLNVAFALVMPQAEIAKVSGKSVAAVYCGKLLGPVGGALAAGVVMCSVFGALAGNILVGPRMLFAMAEDGLAPRGLTAIHPRYASPARAIMTVTAWSMLLTFGGTVAAHLTRLSDPFGLITDFAMFGAIIFETLAVASIFVFRKKLPDAPRPYRCPGYPLTPIIYVLAMAAVLASYFTNESKLLQAGVGLGFVAAGAGVYFVFLRNKVRVEA